MSYGLYKVSFTQVADLDDANADALEESSSFLDGASEERYVQLDFNSDDPYEVALVSDFKAKVSDKVFKAVKKLHAQAATFVII